MSPAEAWDIIARGGSFIDPRPRWANVTIEGGRLMAVHPAGPSDVQHACLRGGDLLGMIEDVYQRVADCKRHPKMRDPRYERVWLALCDANAALHTAMDVWPA
jgi:hypothetical protein